MNIQDIPLKRIDGAPATLGDFTGKVLLVVNVASKCGLTPQYEGLEKLYEARRADGLEVLGFPSNDFAAQEPGTEAEIAEFCKLTYDVKFPLFAKTVVKGPEKHPLYAELIAAKPQAQNDTAMREKLAGFGVDTNKRDEVLWNFEKFLIGRDGQVVGRFSPDVTPDDPALTSAINNALAAPTT